jgi:hypothetical protein
MRVAVRLQVLVLARMLEVSPKLRISNLMIRVDLNAPPLSNLYDDSL